MDVSSDETDGHAAPGREGFAWGRFEARFADRGGATSAARDARVTGFVVDISEPSRGSWLIVGRRREAFPRDEGDRYASRLQAITAHYGGVYRGFVDES
jgi:hypothetical protein